MAPSWRWCVLIWNRSRTLPGICSSSGLRILHGKFTRGIRDGIYLHGEARTFGDVFVRHPVHIEKAVCAIASPEEVDFREAAAPTFERQSQFFPLLFVPLNMQKDVDVAGRPC